MRVWDLPTRIFHWALVAAVAIAAYTGLFGRESWLNVHLFAGYAVAGLVVFRLVWGVFGSAFSRFSSFPLSPRALAAHLRAARQRRAFPYPGHPPLGALMVVAILALLATLVVTGLVALGGEEKQGLLAGVVTYATGHGAKEVHESVALVLLGLVAVHVLGVVVESRLAGDNLVRAMITGRRERAEPAPKSIAGKAARPAVAALSLAVIGGLGAALAAPIAKLPPLGWRPLAMTADYKDACGECHMLYHPSLLPAESWRRLMAELPDHFGEDASLAPETANMVRAWLVANAAETWDTKASNRLRRVSASHPTSITETPFWQRRHDDLPAHLFERDAVRSKSNCRACHADAETGQFADQNIDIPEETDAK